MALGRLEPQREQVVRSHLATCASCRGAYEDSRALANDLSLALDVGGPLPSGLDEGLAGRLLAVLPEMPGDQDPLPNSLRRAGLVLGLSGAAVAGLWLLLLQVMPEGVGEAFRLVAYTAWRVLAGWGDSLMDIAALCLKGSALLLKAANPWSLVAAAFGLVVVELVFATRSRQSRWQS